MKIFVLLITLLSQVALSTAKTDIYFYPSIHAYLNPTDQDLTDGIYSQLRGLLELNLLVKEKPDLPIFAETLFASDDGKVLIENKPATEKLNQALSRITTEYLNKFTTVEEFWKSLERDEIVAIYEHGFVPSLNAIRINSSLPSLHLVPTSPDLENENIKLLDYLLTNRKKVVNVGSELTSRRFKTILPVTLLAAATIKQFCKNFPSPLAVTAIVGAIDFAYGFNVVDAERGKYGMQYTPNIEKLVRYLVDTYREEFVTKQLEDYVREHNPSEVFLSYGAAHQFPAIQSSKILKFVNPPLVTSKAVEFPEIKDTYFKLMSKL
ncbi:MAG: hypothetical protein AB8G05_27550 [Oligoflexales bacterium]